ncbi:hypothetical protein MYCTH_2308284 [Thermothelomyces thermophilus ATCC 42464]|uniref:Uncharacterized protein n=1 Tax=Thermothelomyces thermophilus (strain ATCC 42464 / BCRC 31852 / DSM 1799) TaxID=573729 RepID=G2QJK7_THET4|nr:uncharacterized protein MYCTH_2308284 [Thermothelomyces thermophilus ATCC 42464]AEO59764.1 hypothetical protein MYCTH_2308284 [Thermothelomyces thermophilus ATCC 42464]
MHSSSRIATITTLLGALTGAALALVQPGQQQPQPQPPAVTPPAVLHPAAARFLRLDDRDGLSDLVSDEFSSLRGDVSDVPGDVSSHISEVTRALSTISTGDVAKSSTCWQLYNSFAQSVGQPQPPETNTALASWLASSVLHVGGVLAGNDRDGDLLTATELIQSSLTTECDPSLTATVTPPASLSSAWSTWKEHSSAWIAQAVPAAHSIADRCGGVVGAQVQMLIVTDSESCTKAVLDLVHAVHGGGGNDGDHGHTSGGGGSHTTSASEASTTSSVSPSLTSGASEPYVSPTGGAGGGGGGDDDGNGGSEEEQPTGTADSGRTTGLPTAGAPKETGLAVFMVAAAAAVAGAVVVGL